VYIAFDPRSPWALPSSSQPSQVSFLSQIRPSFTSSPINHSQTNMCLFKICITVRPKCRHKQHRSRRHSSHRHPDLSGRDRCYERSYRDWEDEKEVVEHDEGNDSGIEIIQEQECLLEEARAKRYQRRSKYTDSDKKRDRKHEKRVTWEDEEYADEKPAQRGTPGLPAANSGIARLEGNWNNRNSGYSGNRCTCCGHCSYYRTSYVAPDTRPSWPGIPELDDPREPLPATRPPPPYTSSH